MLGVLNAGCRELDINLSQTQLEQFQAYYQELVSWNERVNLTSITDYEEVQVKHFLDSLSVSLALPQPLPSGLTLLDVGAGGGFPGLPLRIALPEVSLTLFEATAKKARFLEYLVGLLGLQGVAVVVGRAEELAHQPAYRERFEAVTARALAELPSLAELTLPFCRLGGHVIAHKKGDIADELARSEKAIGVMGGRLKEMRSIELREFSDKRSLVIIEKVTATPPKYPRRPGMPEKRPIT